MYLIQNKFQTISKLQCNLAPNKPTLVFISRELTSAPYAENAASVTLYLVQTDGQAMAPKGGRAATGSPQSLTVPRGHGQAPESSHELRTRRLEKKVQIVLSS